MIQSRRGNGQWTRNTLENTVGLSAQVCPHCHAINPRDAFTPPLEVCHACGKSLTEKVARP